MASDERDGILKKAIEFLKGKRTKAELDADGITVQKVAEGDEAKAMLLAELEEEESNDTSD